MPGGTRKLNCNDSLATAAAKYANAEVSPKELRLYKKDFQYQGCELRSLLNARGYQTINIHIYLFRFSRKNG